MQHVAVKWITHMRICWWGSTTHAPAIPARTAGFDVLTYFKGAWARSANEAFTTANYQSPDGTAHTYDLAERLIDLPAPARPQTGGQPASTLRLRLVVRRSPGGHQTPILTNRTDLSAAQVAHRMAARWRQENYFNCADLRVMPTSA